MHYTYKELAHAQASTSKYQTTIQCQHTDIRFTTMSCMCERDRLQNALLVLLLTSKLIESL